MVGEEIPSLIHIPAEMKAENWRTKIFPPISLKFRLLRGGLPSNYNCVAGGQDTAAITNRNVERGDSSDI